MSLQREDWQITLCVITEKKSHGQYYILLAQVVSIGVDGSCWLFQSQVISYKVWEKFFTLLFSTGIK